MCIYHHISYNCSYYARYYSRILLQYLCPAMIGDSRTWVREACSGLNAFCNTSMSVLFKLRLLKKWPRPQRERPKQRLSSELCPKDLTYWTASLFILYCWPRQNPRMMIRSKANLPQARTSIAVEIKSRVPRIHPKLELNFLGNGCSQVGTEPGLANAY